MAGTKASGRPGGNPDFGTKYAFQTDREEPLTENVSLRISASMKSQLKQKKIGKNLFVKRSLNLFNLLKSELPKITGYAFGFLSYFSP